MGRSVLGALLEPAGKSGVAGAVVALAVLILLFPVVIVLVLPIGLLLDVLRRRRLHQEYLNMCEEYEIDPVTHQRTRP